MVDIVELSKDSSTDSTTSSSSHSSSNYTTTNSTTHIHRTNNGAFSHSHSPTQTPALTPPSRKPVINPYNTATKKRRTSLSSSPTSSKRQTSNHKTESCNLYRGSICSKSTSNSNSNSHHVDLTLSPDKSTESKVEVIEIEQQQQQDTLQHSTDSRIRQHNKQQYSPTNDTTTTNDGDDGDDDCLSSSGSGSNSSSHLSDDSSVSSTSSSNSISSTSHDSLSRRLDFVHKNNSNSSDNNNNSMISSSEDINNEGTRVSSNIDNDNTDNITSNPSTSSSMPPPKRSAPTIDPSLYKPPTYQEDKPDPIVHSLTLQNRPISHRQMVPVSKVFQKPISNFWNAKWHSFNHMQSELSQALVYSEDNIVLSAPTGAGKTCVFEMAMGRLLQSEFDNYKRQQYNQNETNQNKKIPNFRKIVYLSPSKALCQERYQDWSKRLSQIHESIVCVLITGDSNNDSSGKHGVIQDIASAHVILTTPEKWDSITRKWTDNLYLIGSVKLLLIDEVHLIGDESRGACLETVICRMKTVQRAAKAQQDNCYVSGDDKKQFSRSANTTPEALRSNMRLVAVSATLPNIGDIAYFLDAHEAYLFDSSYRPVPLTTHVVGLGYIGKNQFLFDKGLNRHVPGLIKRFSKGRSSIIFCHTKKQTEALATELLSSIGSNNDPILASLAQQTHLFSLQKCLKGGVAFHHAGLENQDRQLVERSFSKGLIKCLCATSTLAMGVNLPAQLVIIKGTSVWRGTGQGYQEIDGGTLLQMMGRAGRPGFDDTGTAVIMTDSKSKQYYERMSHGLEIVESMLLKQLAETLNTEISQKVIVNTKETINWLKGTYLYRRARKNTKYYGLEKTRDIDFESYLMTYCVNSLRKLHEARIIDLDSVGNKIQPRKASHVMSRHMIAFNDMKGIVALPHDVGALQLLQTISDMDGIHFPVRRSEKTHLNEAHKLVKYKLQGGPPSKMRIQTPSQKAYILLQAAIGQHFLDDYTLRQEMSLSIEYASRILTAAEDFSIEESKYGQVALESLLLRRCLATSLWGASDGVLNQLRGVGAKTASKLAMNKIRTFDNILLKSSNEIEQACGRKSPFGQELKKVVSKILSKGLLLSAHVEGLESNGEKNELICHLSTREGNKDINGMTNDKESRIVTYTLAVHTDRPGGSLMFRTELNSPGLHRIQCPDKFGRIYIRLVSNLVGLDQKLIIEGNDVVTKSAFALSPLHIKSNKKRKATIKEKNTTKTHEPMTNGVGDFRIIKNRSKQLKGKSDITPPTTKTRQTKAINTGLSPLINQRRQPLVTPSPSFVGRRGSSKSGPKSETPPFALKYDKQHRIEKPTFISKTSSPKSKSQIRKSPYASKHNEKLRVERSMIRDPKRYQTQQGSWKTQRKKQQQFQKRAFGSPKENPFSKFRFDPNCVERQLEIESRNNIERQPIIESSVPLTLNASTECSNGLHIERKYQSLSATAMASKPLNTLIGSARRRKVGTVHQNWQSELLRKKAAEQQAYSSSQHHAAIPVGPLQYQLQDQYPKSGTQFYQSASRRDNIETNNYDSCPSIRMHSQPPNIDILNNTNTHYNLYSKEICNENMGRTSPTEYWNVDSQTFGTNYHPQDAYLGVEENHHSYLPVHDSTNQVDFGPSQSIQNSSFYAPNTLPTYDHTIHDHNEHFNINDSVLFSDTLNQPINMEGMVIRVNSNSNHEHSQDISDKSHAFESAFF